MKKISLARARKNANLTVDDAEMKLCIAAKQISDYETGKMLPTVDVAIRMLQL